MALGRATQNHYSKVLSGIAIDFTPPDLIGRSLFPIVNVKNRADLYMKFDKTLFNDVDDTRADGDEANEVDRGWTYDNYVCEKHALRDFLTRDELDNWDSDIGLESITTEMLKQLVWNRFEVRLMGANGILRQAANNSGSSQMDLSNLVTASPRTSFETAINTIETACGMTPNTVVMGPDRARQIMRTTEYQTERHFVIDMQRVSGAKELPESFYGLKAMYCKSLINTAKKGQAAALTRIMGSDTWIGYVTPTVVPKSVTYGATFMTYEEVRSWFVDGRNATAYEYEANYAPKLVAKEAGYLLTS